MYRKTPNFKRTQEKNPALKIRDFYSFGLQVLNEINYARMHPDEFLQKLEELLSTISPSDNCLYIDGVPFLYTDLKNSLEQAISFLSSQKPLEGLIYNKTITQACDYLLDELIIHDGLNENENTKYNLENRLSKFGQPLGECYELIDYGMFDPEFIVINFILCDGDSLKYERNVLFNPNIKCLGIASSILPSEKICTVINFCEEFYDKYEDIPLEVQMKYNKTVNKYNTKTNKSFLNQKENLNEIDNEMDNYNMKRRDSGKLFSMKRNQYIQRRDSLNKNEKEKEKEKDITLNKEEKNDYPKDNLKEKDNNFRDDRKVIRRKRTIHEPKMMEIIEEEKIENEEPFDREFRIESSKKMPKPQSSIPPEKKITNFSRSQNNNNNNTNTTTETKYIGDKKVTTTTTTETKMGNDGKQQTVTTTTTEEISTEPPKFGNKFVKNIPFKSYGRKKYHDFNDDEFDIEKEMAELEKDFDKEFGHLNLKSPIKPVFDATDDMFENEDDIDIPEGAVSIEVKQKTITDSKGNPVLVVHKTITYENGEKKTIIEKKNIVKK